MNQPHLPQLPHSALGSKPVLVSEPPPPENTAYRLPALFLLLAVITTTLAGAVWHSGFIGRPGLSTDDLIHGFSYSLVILSILLAHEMGHYMACRHYGIRATLPYVVPFLPVLFGTMGAVIRIKSPFVNRRQLFDVGIAGPIAGFVFLLPALIVGLQRSHTAPPLTGEGVLIGTPLLFQWLRPWFYNGDPSALISLHPIGLAAYFGMLATGLNLLPMGQLDGGHIVYALFGAKVHRIVSNLTFFSLLALSLFSWPFPAYLLFALLIRILGFRHPPPLYGMAGSLGKGRIALAAAALLVLFLTFVPFPFRLAGG